LIRHSGGNGGEIVDRARLRRAKGSKNEGEVSQAGVCAGLGLLLKQRRTVSQRRFRWRLAREVPVRFGMPSPRVSTGTLKRHLEMGQVPVNLDHGCE
jgi:hypothetical protein